MRKFFTKSNNEVYGHLSGVTIPKIGDSLAKVEELLGEPNKPWYGDYCHVYDELNVWFKQTFLNHRVEGILISSDKLRFMDQKIIGENIDFLRSLNLEYYEECGSIFVPEFNVELEMENGLITCFNIHDRVPPN